MARPVPPPYVATISEGSVVTDVFANGRKVVDPGADPLSMPTMPIEFSVAAYRFGWVGEHRPAVAAAR